MALIGKIRKNSWVLIVLIGLGLGGFVIMDMFSGQQSMFGSQQTVLAEIEDRKLDIQEFTRIENILYGNSAGDPYGRRNYLWTYFVEETIVNEEADELGLGVSRTELLDLEFGPNDRISPVMTARYQDPNTRQVDRQQLNQFKDIIQNNQINTLVQQGQLSPNFPYFWAHQEKEIIKDRLQTKLVKMVEKALYTPTWMAEMVSIDQNQKVDFVYVNVPFDQIENTEVALENADYAKFLKEEGAPFINDEETRRVEYVAFDVLPTAKDSADIKAEISDLMTSFKSTDNDSLFVENNYGSISAQWFTKDDLYADIADTVFQLPVGAVHGPYAEGVNYKAVKVLDRKVMADSANSRHILRSAQTPAQFAQAAKTVDSLKNLILAGTHQFDSLAMQFSQDPGSATKGGLYEGTPVNQFVPEYNDVLFVTGQIGQLYAVRTQFGVHLIEIMSRTAATTERVKVAYVTQPIIPSEETQRAVREQALEFVENNRTLDALSKAVAARDDIEMETSPFLKRNDYFAGSLGSGPTARDIVRWAFNNDINTPSADIGDVSPEVYGFEATEQFYTNKYVVVGLKAIQEAGLPSVANIKQDIELQVINRKKGAMLAERMKGKSDLASIAATFDEITVDTSKGVSFSGGFIPNVGAEPKVVAAALNLDVNQISEPIVGNSGVFVVMPTFKPAAQPSPNLPQVRSTNQSSIRSQVAARLMPAIQKNIDITDNRARFY